MTENVKESEVTEKKRAKFQRAFDRVQQRNKITKDKEDTLFDEVDENSII